MRVLSIVLALALATFAPLATAAPPACAAEPALGPPTGPYVRNEIAQSRIQVWEESNGVAGLQRAECTDAGGLVRGPDRHVATIPVINCIGTICIL